MSGLQICGVLDRLVSKFEQVERLVEPEQRLQLEREKVDTSDESGELQVDVVLIGFVAQPGVEIEERSPLIGVEQCRMEEAEPQRESISRRRLGRQLRNRAGIGLSGGRWLPDERTDQADRRDDYQPGDCPPGDRRFSATAD